MAPGNQRRRKIAHESRILLLALAAGLPAVLVSLTILWTGEYTAKVQWTLSVVLAGTWLACAFAARERVISPLRTVANLLEAMREGDYSIRATAARGRDALAEVMQQVNAMGATLRAQRLGALEATTLLRKVMEEIDVAIFAFDEKQCLRLVNRGGERLLAQPAERLLNLDAEALGLAGFLAADPEQPIGHSFPGASGRWRVSRSAFREGGLPHQLLVLTDLTRTLREEELLAWQRLVRVLGHELNNSLAPIKSIAGSLESLLQRQPWPEDWEDDMARGLSVISARSEALGRFMGAYAKLARLPRPRLAPLQVGEWIERVVRLETRLPVQVVAGPAVRIDADGDQLDQMLINLLRNAVDASLETGGGVKLGWQRFPMQLEVWIEDDGPGLPATSNLFVPFFTTKKGGSGIGLVLSRQIAEAHGGALTLENRAGASGCRARLVLPL